LKTNKKENQREKEKKRKKRKLLEHSFFFFFFLFLGFPSFFFPTHARECIVCPESLSGPCLVCKSILTGRILVSEDENGDLWNKNSSSSSTLTAWELFVGHSMNVRIRREVDFVGDG